MSEVATIMTVSDHLESARIKQVVQNAADEAFRARVKSAVTRRVNEHGMTDLARSKRASGIDRDRWAALCLSTREAASSEEFQRFARVLRVSPRWLAIGVDDDDDVHVELPLAGWEAFGTHVDRPEAQLEFSTRVDQDSLPMWERERERSQV